MTKTKTTAPKADSAAKKAKSNELSASDESPKKTKKSTQKPKVTKKVKKGAKPMAEGPVLEEALKVDAVVAPPEPEKPKIIGETKIVVPHYSRLYLSRGGNTRPTGDRLGVNDRIHLAVEVPSCVVPIHESGDVTVPVHWMWVDILFDQSGDGYESRRKKNSFHTSAWQISHKMVRLHNGKFYSIMFPFDSAGYKNKKAEIWNAQFPTQPYPSGETNLYPNGSVCWGYKTAPQWAYELRMRWAHNFFWTSPWVIDNFGGTKAKLTSEIIQKLLDDFDEKTAVPISESKLYEEDIDPKNLIREFTGNENPWITLRMLEDASGLHWNITGGKNQEIPIL